MAGSFPDSVNPGLFLPTTPMFDVGDLDNQENLKQLVVQLTQAVNNMANAVNLKDSGLYYQQQFINGQTFFPNPALSATTAQAPQARQVYRQTYLIGPLPNTATLNTPHNIPITNIFTFTRIYGVANSAAFGLYAPIPFVAPNGNYVTLALSPTNIVITTNFDATGFDINYVVLEWLAQ